MLTLAATSGLTLFGIFLFILLSALLTLVILIQKPKGGGLAGAFGGGIAEGPQSLADVTPDVIRAIERQTRLRDATGKAKAREGVLTLLRQEFRSRAENQDFADDEVRKDFTAFVDDTIGNTRNRLKQQTGLSRLTDQALASFDQELDQIAETFRDEGDALHLMSLEKRGMDQITETAADAARGSATALARRSRRRHPGDSS